MKNKRFALFTLMVFFFSLLPLQPLAAATPSPDAAVTVIIEVEGAPVLAQKEASRNGAKSYLTTKGAQNAEKEIRQHQAKVLSEINQLMADDASTPKGKTTAKAQHTQSLTPTYSYTHVTNGFSLTVPQTLVDEIRALPAVKAVYPVHRYPAQPPATTTRASQTKQCCQAIGVDTLHQQNIRGEGQVVAVIDTELDIHHEFFAGEVRNPTIRKETVHHLLKNGQLNIDASETIDHVYRSSKMPLVYNYYTQSDNVFNANPHLIHGSHVSGIACGRNGTAANGERFNGIAPEAQLLFMSAVSPNDFYFSDDCVIAAIDDAVKLGADVINMSFGADYADASEVKTQAINNARNAGIFLSAASSNASRTAANDDNNNIRPQQTDYSTLGEPANIESTTAVASTAVAHNNSTLSDFSGWGPSTDLSLKPEITAPGDDIYSAVPTSKHNNNHYQYISGCSMATPHISGAAALLKQYIHVHQERYSKAFKKMSVNTLIENLMMSTATILDDNTHPEIAASPRQQGAGQLNLEDAIRTPVVLSGTNGKSKICLYDHIDEATQQYTLTFEATNFSNQPVTYDTIDVSAITDDTNNNGYVEGMKALTIASVTMPESITIPAGQTVPVSIDVTLDAQAVKNNLRIFRNGFFVDGFVTLTSENNKIPSVHLPYSGYYGNWTQAPAFDQPLLSGDSQLHDTMLYTMENVNRLRNDLGTHHIFSHYLEKDTPTGYLHEENSGISPNGDGWGDDLYVHLQTLRDANISSITITDKANQPIYSLPLDAYHTGKFTENDFNLSPATALLKSRPDGDYTVHITGRFNHANSPSETIQMDFYTDTVSPTLTDWEIKKRGNKTLLSFHGSDDRGLMGAVIKGDTVGHAFEPAAIFVPTKDTIQPKSKDFNIDITNIKPNTLTVSLYDYALNHYDVHGSTASPFIDVSENDWFFDAVTYTNEHHLMMGIDARHFGPNRTTNRAQLVTTLWRMIGSPTDAPAPEFADVAPNAYYTQAVAWANQAQIVTGYGNACFGPEDTLTREQMATIFYRFAAYQERDTTVEDTHHLDGFADVATVQPWACEALNWAVEENLIGGMPDNRLAPQNTTTRAQLATVLTQYDKNIS